MQEKSKIFIGNPLRLPLKGREGPQKVPNLADSLKK
jgi:hypothetical protein